MRVRSWSVWLSVAVCALVLILGGCGGGGSTPANHGGDTTPSTGSLTSPMSGAAVSGRISVTAMASDNVAVASVQLQVDGAGSGSADTASPYKFSLDTTAPAKRDPTSSG